MAYHLFRKGQKVRIDLGFGDSAEATVLRSDIRSVLIEWLGGRQTWVNASLLSKLALAALLATATPALAIDRYQDWQFQQNWQQQLQAQQQQLYQQQQLFQMQQQNSQQWLRRQQELNRPPCRWVGQPGC